MPIQRSRITVDSHWGARTEHELYSHSPAPSALVVCFPGENYSCDRPLLHYARKVALLHGCDVLSLEYGFQAARIRAEMDEAKYVVAEATEAVRQALRPEHKRLCFISKSLGTYMAGEVAQALGADRVTHLYLTPLPMTIPHLRASRGMVVVGTRDQYFKPEHREQIAGLPDLELYVVPDAPHSLEVDDVGASLDIVRMVADLCARLISG